MMLENDHEQSKVNNYPQNSDSLFLPNENNRYSKVKNRQSLLFGERPIIVTRDSKIHRYNNDLQVVRMGYFWYWFRRTLPLTSLALFLLTFFIARSFFNSTDGYLLCGGFLSLLFCFLSILSYFHVKPWQRHPSSLLISVCLMSFLLSLITVIMAYPSHNDLSKLNDGSDINIIGTNDYNDTNDNHFSCLLMSFLLQLTLFSREMWILTLSWDLLVNITNPFASYLYNLKKYHLFIWFFSLFSCLLLINHDDCHGEFLNNGMCWIKITGIEDWCFWGYFMIWVILFYVNALAILTYAYCRIAKGLENTFATHYLFVVDTFRIVFFFFVYGVILAILFVILYYMTSLKKHRDNLLTLEHLFAYLIATRGFFDSLVWFFTHGFTDEATLMDRQPQADEEGEERRHKSNLRSQRNSVISMQSLMRSISNKHSLTMNDIFKPKLWLFECIKLFPLCFYCCTSCFPSTFSFASSHGSHRQTRDGFEDEDEGEDDYDDENGLLVDDEEHLRQSQYLTTPMSEGGISLPPNDNPNEKQADVTSLLLSNQVFIERKPSSNGRLPLDNEPGSSKANSGTLRRDPSMGTGRGSESYGRNSSGLGSVRPDGETFRATASSSSQFFRNSSINSTSRSNNRSIHILSQNIDFSPQLNLALRTEVVHAVTLGIKESVLKLNEREKRLTQLAQQIQTEVIEEESRKLGSFSSSKSGQSGATAGNNGQAEEFVRIRLSSSSNLNSVQHNNEVSNILRDIYAGTSGAPQSTTTRGGGFRSYFASSTVSSSVNPLSSVPKSSSQANKSQKQLNEPPNPQKSSYKHSISASYHPVATNQPSVAYHTGETGGDREAGLGKKSYYFPAGSYAAGTHNNTTTNSILHSLMSVTGAFLPGEYGIDTMSYMDSLKVNNSNVLMEREGGSSTATSSYYHQSNTSNSNSLRRIPTTTSESALPTVATGGYSGGGGNAIGKSDILSSPIREVSLLSFLFLLFLFSLWFLYFAFFVCLALFSTL
jgi:uncharacterized membrane protein